MNVVLRQTPAREAASPATGARLAYVSVSGEMADAEPAWRTLERQPDALVTPYQRYEFLAPWQRHIGQAEGVTPFIVTGFDAGGAPLFVWPLGQRKHGPFHIVEFLGGKHVNVNLALWRRDAIAAATGIELARVLAEIARHQVDAMVLLNQPFTWQGAENPLALLPQKPSPDFLYSGALTADFDALLEAHTSATVRKKMRKKERTLASFGTVRFERVSDAGIARRVLDAFFVQKAARMHALGVPDAFAAPGARQFIETAATQNLADGTPAIELYALWLDDTVVATAGGAAGGGRFCGMFNSFLSGRYGAESPGEQIILNLVRSCCERGLNTFDLGIGTANYKSLFCENAEPLFDTIRPLSPAGHAVVLSMQLARGAKRAIKQNPQLWSAVQMLRHLRAHFESGR